MSDLAKKCADAVRRDGFEATGYDRYGDTFRDQPMLEALAAFIEAAQACRSWLMCLQAGYIAPYKTCGCRNCTNARTYDAALRDLAQSMEVE